MSSPINRERRQQATSDRKGGPVPSQDRFEDSNDRTGMSAAEVAGPLVTLFAIPKPFAGHTAVIQKNAIRSWASLDPQVEIILFGGDEPGLRAISEETGARLLPIRVNESGTPYLSDAFEQVHQQALGQTLAYVNCDILLGPDLMEVIELIQASFDSFLGIGTRINLDVARELSFQQDAEFQQLIDRAKKSGRPSSIVCKDYFLFSRDLYRNISDFLVGRGNWDNWMVHHAKCQGIPVVDLTGKLAAVHQEHGHSHVKGGRMSAYISGDEARQNQRLAGGRHLVSGSTATWKLTENGPVRISWPIWPLIQDAPRFLALMRNLMFMRYFSLLSPLIL